MAMLKIMFLFVFALAALFSGCVSVEKAKTTGIVIVGMGQSAKYGKCEGAAKDASTMAGILSKYGTPQILVNNQATKANVVNALKVASQNDLMIFFYSGHGGSDPIGDVSGEPDKKNEYLCLYNGYLLDNEIWNIICGAKNRVLLIFDCCHSETMFRSSGIDQQTHTQRRKRPSTGQSEPHKDALLVWLWRRQLFLRRRQRRASHERHQGFV